MYSPVGVLLKEWCHIDGNNVITLVAVVRNGISVGKAGDRPGLNSGIFVMMFKNFAPPP